MPDRPHFHDDVIDYDLHFGPIDPPIHNLHLDRPCDDDNCARDDKFYVLTGDEHRHLHDHCIPIVVVDRRSGSAADDTWPDHNYTDGDYSAPGDRG